MAASIVIVMMSIVVAFGSSVVVVLYAPHYNVVSSYVNVDHYIFQNNIKVFLVAYIMPIENNIITSLHISIR